MSNEIGDLITAASISSNFGAPKRYASLAARELLRKRPQGFYDFENGITGTPLRTYITGSSLTPAAALSATMNTNLRLSARGASAIAAVHGLASPTVSSGTLFFAGQGKFVFECALKLNALATTSEDYLLQFGLLDRADGGATNIIGFEYLRSAQTTWRLRTLKAGSGGNSTGPTVNTNFNVFRIEVNGIGTSVAFFINDVLVGTNASGNIPNALANAMSLVVCSKMTTTAGAAYSVFDIDWLAYDYQPTTSR